VRKPTRFEWDPAKAESNLRKHGVPFEAGARVFDDEHRVDLVDERFDYGEERRNATGLVEGVSVTVTYTMRGEETARIISAHPASRKERKHYGQDR
jgi:uncharacterized DUF497 family protein